MSELRREYDRVVRQREKLYHRLEALERKREAVLFRIHQLDRKEELLDEALDER